MGLIRQGFTAMRDLVTDQYRGLYAVDAMDADVLAVRAGKRIRDRKGLLRREDTGVITDGSVIVVGEGQCMIVTDQGRITEVCAEAGEFVYENDGAPSVFYGTIDEDKANAVLSGLYRRLDSFQRCAGCRLLTLCRGCPAVAAATHGSFYAPDPQCWRRVEG